MNIKIIFFIASILILISCDQNKNNSLNGNSSVIVRFPDTSIVSNSWPTQNNVIVHFISEPDNLHPTNGNSAPRSEIFQYTQRPLMYIDFENQKVIPGIVISMPEISDDGLKYSYKLRKEVHWDNGNNVTADDIIFTAKAFKCPLTNDPAVKFYWNNVDEIIANDSDPLSFSIVMKYKHIQNISFLTGFSIMQRSLLDPENILSHFSLREFSDTTFHAQEHPDLIKWAAGFNNDSNGRDVSKMNGLGMYKVEEWNTGQYITLRKKTNHWSENSSDYHEKSFPEKIIFKLNKDETSQFLDFKNQSMDVSVNISSSTLLKLNSDQSIHQNYNLAMMPTYNYTYVAFNEKPDGISRKKLFTDVSVRKAISHLIPVDDLIRLVYGPYSSSCRKMSANVSAMKSDYNKELTPATFDITGAIKILSNAGWKDSDNDGVLDKIIDGQKTDMIADLQYMSTATEWKDMAMIISENCAKAGVRINPVGMDLKLFLEKAKAHDFDLILGSWGASALPEDFTQLFHTSSWINHGSNYPGFGNPASDSLIEAIVHEMNDTARISLSHKLQKMIYDDVPYVFLYSSMRRNIIHKRFGNQMIFAERPGILYNMLRLLSINKGITLNDEVTP